MEKRMIVPALFGFLAVAVGAAYVSLFMILPIPVIFKVLIGGGFAAVAIAMVYVIIQRKKEMQEEDKDDLGKY